MGWPIRRGEGPAFKPKRKPRSKQIPKLKLSFKTNQKRTNFGNFPSRLCNGYELRAMAVPIGRPRDE
jgi:hypothetical protein